MPNSDFPYYKNAFFSAFTTVNNFTQSNKFFTNEISPIFKEFRSALQKMENDNNNGNIISKQKHLYNPIPYCLFGDFDLAIFSLIDDFAFATQKFKPLSSTKVFKYQVNTGIIPLINAYADIPNLNIFETKKLPDFFSGKESYPFTGIVSIKLNNDILVGIGKEFLDLINLFLVTYIDIETNKLNKKGIQLFYILNENLGWNEITINFFGNSMTAIQNLIFSIRSYSLSDIKIHFEKLLRNSDFAKTEINKIIKTSFKNIGSKSLLSKLIGTKNLDFLSSHPFIAISVSYGFHAQLSILKSDKNTTCKKFNFNEIEYKQFQKECSKKAIAIGWKIKPGHEMEGSKILGKLFPNKREKAHQNILSGKYSFRFPKDKITINEYLNMELHCSKGNNREELSKHITKCRSRIRWESTISHSKIRNKLYYHNLEKYQIKKNYNSKLQDALRIYPIPHTFKSQIENIIINFNDAIADPLMHNYFIGLKGALLNFLDYHFKSPKYNTRKQKDLAHLNLLETFSSIFPFQVSKVGNEQTPIAPKPVEINNISLFIQTWNKAYWNRYFHSYYFTEINDFNIEHHGGIQQILLTYDVVYKLISKRIYGKNCKRPFINVQIGSTISSSQFYNTVNFTHLFTPAIYACECVHEVSNYIIPFLIEKGFNDFELLMNPRNDTIKAERLAELEKMEENIYDSINPMDDFEVRYIRDRFGLNTSRHIFADYTTFKLAYQNDNILSSGFQLSDAIKFCNTHWYLLLMRADLYAREPDGQGAWFFMEDEFKTLFIRFNLMFYLCFDLDISTLMELNSTCPSVELKPFWESSKLSLIKFVIRLGDAFKQELDNKIDQNPEYDAKGFTLLMKIIDDVVITKCWEGLGEEEQQWYNNVYEFNNSIINEFNSHFNSVSGKTNYNILKRLSKNKESNIDGINSNIEFYANINKREIYLDPKGNIFSTTTDIRETIFKYNVTYIKKMWDLSLKILLKDYKENAYV